MVDICWPVYVRGDTLQFVNVSYNDVCLSLCMVVAKIQYVRNWDFKNVSLCTEKYTCMHTFCFICNIHVSADLSIDAFNVRLTYVQKLNLYIKSVAFIDMFLI